MVKEFKKRLVALILVAGLLLGNLAGHGIVLHAAEAVWGTVGAIRWDLDEEGNLLFRGSYKFPLLEPDKIPWREYASRIRSVTFEVSSIQDGDLTNYFYHCVNLQSVGDFPEGIRNLTQTFQDCRSLRSVGKIPDSVETMERTFENCTSFNQTVVIPENVKNLKGTFQGCSSLTRLPEIETTQVKDYSYFLYGTSVTSPIAIPKGVTDLTGTFGKCKNLTAAPALPEGITQAEKCFYECIKLTKAPQIPQTAENIKEMFYGCESLTAVPDIPDSVKDMSGCYAKCTHASGEFTIYAVVNAKANYSKFAASTAVCNSSAKGEFLGAAGSGLSVNYIATNAHLIRRYLAEGWNCGNLETEGEWGKLKVGKKIALSLENATVSELPAVTYTGKAYCPKPEVYYGVTKLKEDTDYTLSYNNNINAGTASITIAGIGNYSGTKKLTFVINNAVMTGIKAQSYQGVYDEKSHSIAVQIPTGAIVLYGTKSGEYTLSTPPAYTLPGNYTVYYRVSKENYKTVTGSANVSIVQGTMPVVANGYSGVYDGKEHGISVAGVKGAQIRYGTSAGQYTIVECPKYKDVGIYTIYYQVSKEGYGSVTGKQQVEIKRKVVSDVAFPTTNETEYGCALREIPLNGNEEALGTFTWEDPDYVPTVDDKQEKMCFEPFDKKNYDYSEVTGYDSDSGNIMRDVILSIRRKKGELPDIFTGFLAEGDELELSEILPDHLDVGDFFWAKPDEKVTQNKSEYTLIFRPKDMRNYDWSDLDLTELDWNSFQIQQKVDVVPYPEPIEIVYGDTLESKAFVGKNPNVKYRWLDETIAPTETGVQKLRILYQEQEIEREMEVVVLKRKPDYVIPVLESICYAPEQTLGDIPLPKGWNWTDSSLVPEAGEQNYDAYYEPEDTMHYQTVYEKIQLQVKKAVPKVTLPYIQMQLEKETICLRDITLPDGWNWKEPERNLSEGNYKIDAVFVPEDVQNYQNWEGQIEVVLKKKTVEDTKPDVTSAPQQTTKPDTTAIPGGSGKPGSTATPGGSGKPGTTATPGGSGKPGTTAIPSGSGKPGTTATPGESGKPGTTATPGESSKPDVTSQPSMGGSVDLSSAEKKNEIHKDAVVSTKTEDSTDKNTPVFGVKKQNNVLEKVKFKKIQYRKRKVQLCWKKVKKAKGYQVVFLKRKNGKTRMVKFVKKNKLSLAWNGVGKCFVKIRAFQTKGKRRIYGKWSVCKQVKKR